MFYRVTPVDVWKDILCCFIINSVYFFLDTYLYTTMEKLRTVEQNRWIDKRIGTIKKTQAAIGNNIKDWSWLKWAHPAKNRKIIYIKSGTIPRIKRLYDDNPYL